MFSFTWRKGGAQPRGKRSIRSSRRRSFRPFLEVLEDRMVLSTPVDTAAAAGSAIFSTQSQNVSLSATVTDPANSSDIVNEGTVTFTVEDSSNNPIGTAVTGTVSNGSATATYSLPASQAAGSYSIDVTYDDSSTGTYSDGGDTSNTLTVSPANVTTTASAATAAFSPASQDVTLNATLADTSNSSDTVNEGTVTFTVKDSNGNTIGTPVTVNVSNDAASTSYSLPAGQALGSYTIDVSYDDSSTGDFTDSGDTSNTLTVTAANVTTTASAANTTFSTAAQTVSLNATLADTSNSADQVNEGTVTFTVKDSNGNTIGTPVTANVSNDAASTSYSLPAGQAHGSYTIDVSYSDTSGNFTDSGDTSGTLTISPADVTTTANAATVSFSAAPQPVSLTATVTDSSNSGEIVNAGNVTFTVVDSNGNTIGSAVTAPVNNGHAATSYSLPAGLAAGSYTINVSYADAAGNFTDNGDNSGSLQVGTSDVATTAQGGTFTFSGPGQPITVQANVSNLTNPGVPVNAGSVTFTLVDSSGNIIGSSTTGSVSNGLAAASYVLPTGLAPGTYTLQVSYNDPSGNFTDTSDTPATLTLNFTPPGSLINQVFSNLESVPLNLTPSGSAATSLQLQTSLSQISSSSQNDANTLIQDEIMLLFDLAVGFDQTMMGINDPTFSAQIAAQEQAVVDNPLYSTPTGYTLATAAGALAAAALTQPTLAQQAEAAALTQATQDNAQFNTTDGYDLGVSIGAMLVNNFNPPSPSVQANLNSLQQSAGSNPLNSTAQGFQLGLMAGELAALGVSQPSGSQNGGV